MPFSIRTEFRYVILPIAIEYMHQKLIQRIPSIVALLIFAISSTVAIFAYAALQKRVGRKVPFYKTSYMPVTTSLTRIAVLED